MKLTLPIMIAAVAPLGSLTACHRLPEMKPRLILPGEAVGNGFWFAAPYVAVVKIARADLQGSREPIYQGGPKTLQLVKFVADVENVVKGDLPSKTISFFFFYKVDEDQNYYLDPGKRYIVSLRREGGLLRSWADASQLRIPVHSGSHNQKDLPLDLGPAATVAYILLTPGTGCDLGEFEANLTWPPYASGDPGYVNERLKALERQPDPGLRDSACLAAANIFWYRPKCLDQALEDPDARIRQSAAKRLKEGGGNFVGYLRNNSFTFFPSPETNFISQMLEIYTEDTRPEVRRAACVSLQSFAPEDGAELCK